MRKINGYFAIMKVIFDFIIIFSSFFIAKQIRLHTDLIPNVNLPIQTLNDIDLFNYAIFGAVILIIIFLIHGLYKFNLNTTKLKEFSQLTIYSFYSFIFFTVVVYLSQGFVFNTEIPRLIIGFTFIIGTIGIIIERVLLNYIQTKVSRKRNVLVFSNNVSEGFYELIDSFKKSKIYNIVGVANNYKLGTIRLKEFSIEESEDMIKNREIDEILYLNSDLGKDDLLKLKKLIHIFGIKYKFVADNSVLNGKTIMTLMDSLPVLEIQTTSLQGWNSIFKRIFDLFGSIIGIILFSPILILVAILIKIEDPKGPVIFKNRRVGRDGKEFDLYKFRYMKWKFCTKDSYEVSEEDKKAALEYEEKLIKEKSTRSGPLYKIEDDPRKTKIGAFIEKYSIDELPQFFNVLIGNMSIVGPRPHQPREVEKYNIEHMRLLTIKPGITGMAQVNGRETNTFDDEANLDLYYIDNWSILLEIKILFKTIYVVLTRK